jgi:hypothetical protein
MMRGISIVVTPTELNASRGDLMCRQVTGIMERAYTVLCFH